MPTYYVGDYVSLKPKDGESSLAYRIVEVHPRKRTLVIAKTGGNGVYSVEVNYSDVDKVFVKK